MGLLKTREIMQPYATYMHEVSYCKYGTEYRKGTNVWTNAALLEPVHVCSNQDPCLAKKRYGRHPVSA